VENPGNKTVADAVSLPAFVDGAPARDASGATLLEVNPVSEEPLGVTPRLVRLSRLAGLHDDALNAPGLGILGL
jgi:hypothetical protein